MIRVQKNYDNIPGKLNGKLAEEKRKQALIEKKQHKALRSYYADVSVKEALKGIYHSKCGYCENAHTASSPLRVDHFRPKKGIQEDESHPGYYWLVYEWSNLIYSCENCNQPKKNHFPIKGRRVEAHQGDRKEWLANSQSFFAENPLLLNPERDNPEEHLIFFPDGKVKEKNGSKKGETTIRICRLNREELVLARKNQVEQYSEVFTLLFRMILERLAEKKIEPSTKEGEEAFKKIYKEYFKEKFIEMKKPKRSFSRLGWHMVEEFSSFFLEEFPQKTQEIINNVFQTLSKH